MVRCTNLGDDEITVVQGSTVETDENVVVTGLGNGALLLDEAIEALLLAGDDPLRLSRRERHCELGIMVNLV